MSWNDHSCHSWKVNCFFTCFDWSATMFPKFLLLLERVLQWHLLHHSHHHQGSVRRHWNVFWENRLCPQRTWRRQSWVFWAFWAVKFCLNRKLLAILSLHLQTLAIGKHIETVCMSGILPKNLSLHVNTHGCIHQSNKLIICLFSHCSVATSADMELKKIMG